MEVKDILEILEKRILECINLSSESKKAEAISNLVGRHISELNALILGKGEDEIKSKFSNFVNKILNIVEALGLSETQYKATRRLILNEIYGAQNLIVEEVEKNKKTVEK